MNQSSVLIVGSLAYDDLEMPSGTFENVVGGAATYSSIAASIFAPVRLVGVIGEDFPNVVMDDLVKRGVDIAGVERAKGKTFRWRGRYSKDLSTRETLDTQLNVFADFRPKIPAAFKSTPYVLLGNIHPALQLEVLAQVEKPKLVVADTMNFWITGEGKLLAEVMKKVDLLVINDEEARELTGIHNLVKAAADIRKRGPSRLIVKRGEHGALYFDDAGTFFAPAYPLEEVVDPTGAGDSFAGGLMGYITRANSLEHPAMRRAIYFGSALGSFCVEGIGPRRLLDVSEGDVKKRMAQFMSLVETGGPVGLPRVNPMDPQRRRRLAVKLALGAAFLGGAAWVIIACSDDPHRRTSPEQAAGGGGACAAKPGELPPPNCDDSENQCVSRPGCVIDEARCGSKSTCLPIGDNKGKDVQDFRIRRLKIATPEALAGELIQNTVVTLNIDLAEKSCGEQGKGLFTWLLQVDRKNNTLITGGAPPPTDAIGQGFCFARFDLGSTKVEPITSKVEFMGDTFKSTQPQKVKIPIFLSADVSSVILLPITDVVVSGVTISDDGNCIGHLNDIALDPQCFDDSLCSKWQTSGALGGFITLDEADDVKIKDLNNKSLCSFLAGEPDHCARDASGKIMYQGDFCSKDKQPGSCADSVWLAATFAASAAKIFDGKGTVPGCSGVQTVMDAGEEAGTDSGMDAGITDAADGG